jgi:hypothetical protein
VSAVTSRAPSAMALATMRRSNGSRVQAKVRVEEDGGERTSRKRQADLFTERFDEGVRRFRKSTSLEQNFILEEDHRRHHDNLTPDQSANIFRNTFGFTNEEPNAI